MAPSQRLFPVDEARQRFGLSRSTIYNWRSEGRLSRYRIGRRALVDLDELAALVTCDERPAQREAPP